MGLRSRSGWGSAGRRLLRGWRQEAFLSQLLSLLQPTGDIPGKGQNYFVFARDGQKGHEAQSYHRRLGYFISPERPPG